MGNEKQQNWKRLYKLKNFCKDCANEKKYWDEDVCFEHRYENPLKLKKDQRELKRWIKTSAFLLGLIFLLVNILLAFTIFWTWSIIPTLIYYPFVSYLIIKEYKEIKRDWKEIKTKQNQWIKKSPNEQ